jgi:hypothetical protein
MFILLLWQLGWISQLFSFGAILVAKEITCKEYFSIDKSFAQKYKPKENKPLKCNLVTKYVKTKGKTIFF